MYRPHVSKFEAAGSPAANGFWWYETGVAGAVVIPQGVYVVTISAACAGVAGSVQVGAMGAIGISAGGYLVLSPNGGIRGDGIAAITFTDTTSYVIEVIL
jgi:hypothetical protein